MKTAFGLDLAGYSTGKSGFVRADRKDDNSIEITIFQRHAFSEECDGKKLLKNINDRETELLKACCKKGRLLVDIPIDLQELPCPNNVSFIWELVRRPVDFAFDAMPPLADRIGAPVTRFLNLFSSIKEEFPLGKQIFETYPAGSLKLLNSQVQNLPFEGYKKQHAQFKNGCWGDRLIDRIANALKLTSEQNITLNDDELDAIICAITGVVDRENCLMGDDLVEMIRNKMKQELSTENFNRFCAPVGYILLKSLPNIKISIIKMDKLPHKKLLQEVGK